MGATELLRGSFAYEGANRLEMRGGGGATPLEQDRFSRGDNRAGGAKAVEGDLMIEKPAGTHSIGDDVRPEALMEQIQDRLLHADVCLHTGDDDLHSLRRLPGSENGFAFTATEPHLLGGRTEARCKLWQRLSEPLGILLRRRCGNAEDRRGIQEPPDVPDQSLRLAHQRSELFLDIDHQERAALDRQEQRTLRAGHVTTA